MRHTLIRLALLTYPRAFRRRFGNEMRADLQRRMAEHEPRGAARLLVTAIASGLAERWSALVRLLFWPHHRPHLYQPSGRHAMFWDSLRSDLQHAIRLAIKTPTATSLTILALALGIGATTAIFAVVNSVLLKPLPYDRPERLVVVWSDAGTQGRPRNTMSPANYRDFATANQTLERLEAYFSFVTPFELAADGATEVVIGVTVSPHLFPMLGRSPALGRPFGDDPAEFEVLVSHGYWQRRFGGDPAVVGRKVQMNGGAATIVGVMPADFTFPYGTMLGPSGFTRVTTVDVWAPMAYEGPRAVANRMLTADGQLVRGTHWLGAIGRMKPGVSVADVQADLSTIARQLEQSYPETNVGWGATVVPILDQTVGTLRTPLVLLLSGVAFVLLIAAVNVANLVLARSIARQKELATRVALGAGLARLVQQAVTEGLLLSAAGGLAGAMLGYWSLGALVAIAPPDLPRLDEVTLDPRVMLLAALVTLVTGVFVGLLPALAASRLAPQAALQESSRGTSAGAFRHRARASLVIAEIALAVTLTVGAGLLLRSFASLLAVDPGFRPENLLTWQMNVPDRAQTPEQRTAFYNEFLDRMRALPGVLDVGGTTRLPLGSTGLTTYVDVDGQPRPQAEWPEVQFRRALGNYFQTMGIPILRGRTFLPNEEPASGPQVCVINQVLAARLFSAGDPIGQHVRTGPNAPWMRIVGVVGDIKHGALDEELAPELYIPHRGGVSSPYIVLRTSVDADRMLDIVRAEARAIDDDLPLYRVQTMESVRAESMAQRRFILALVTLFGLLALVLAGIGVYSVMSLLVSERTQEVGIRLALGAHPSHVLRMIVAQATGLALTGVLIGGALSLTLMPLIATELYAVQPRDPLTLVGVPVVLLAVAILAALVPARRAMRVDPVRALRQA